MAMGKPRQYGRIHQPGAVVIDVGMNRITSEAEVNRLFSHEPSRLAAFAKNGSVLVGDVEPLAMQEEWRLHASARRRGSADHCDVDGQHGGSSGTAPGMLKVGLTGGYATGKSLVAKELEGLGCHLIYADELGHEVLRPDGEAYAATVETFGREILNSDGTIDRKRLGEIVFASPELLEQLSALVHPAVIRLEERLIEEFQTKDPHGIAVIEAAILL